MASRLISTYPDDPRPTRWHQPVLALGNFDGMHRGHLKIVERVRRVADERNGDAVAMTFEPHPSKIVRPDKAPPLLMTHQQKLDALGRAGMHGVAVIRGIWDAPNAERAASDYLSAYDDAAGT